MQRCQTSLYRKLPENFPFYITWLNHEVIVYSRDPNEGVVDLFSAEPLLGDQQMMAQKDGAKPFRVAVVGLPSSSPNSNSGAGKSCLCNRFTRSGEDDYSSNHSSVLNHEDFNG